MNKLLGAIAFFAVFLMAENTAHADENTGSSLNKMGKHIEKPLDNPWDPRKGGEASSSQDDSGKEALPEPEQSESMTEE